GIVTFVSDRWEGEYMHLFTATDTEGTLIESCDEGDLEWVDQETFRTLPQWEGDRIFLDLLEQNEPFFSLKLEYEGSILRRAVLNGRELGRNEK
ncbi:MAG: DNA mismatch repair protein MutT, partial [Clostridia bacterium]|nr:DNA mismatch repair protein MutT [Clostridia bacterium]